jgi:integrase
MLRFLISEGQVTIGLEAAVPMPRQWALGSLPHHLSKDQVSQVLAVCRNTKPNELRNSAVAWLGLRAGEVASLCLEDIHWAEGRLLIRAGKSRRERTLPLGEQMGHALVEYLQHRRPRTLHRRVFLQCHAPYGPLTNVAISHIARPGLTACRYHRDASRRTRLSPHRGHRDGSRRSQFPLKWPTCSAMSRCKRQPFMQSWIWTHSCSWPCLGQEVSNERESLASASGVVFGCARSDGPLCSSGAQVAR